MIEDNIITVIHILLFYAIALSPFIHDINYKRLILILILFISAHFLTKYGKCGVINAENYVRGDDIHNGFFFKLIKPVICYKRNPFYNYFYILLIYIFILYYQIREGGGHMNLLIDVKDIIMELYEKYYKSKQSDPVLQQGGTRLFSNSDEIKKEGLLRSSNGEITHNDVKIEELNFNSFTL
jgi:hypothetical protein